MFTEFSNVLDNRNLVHISEARTENQIKKVTEHAVRYKVHVQR
jgi:hypothetical protein